MPSIIRGLKYLFHNRVEFCDSIIKNFFRFLPDKYYLSLRYRCRMGKWIDWHTPKTFSEKIQWLKIYNRRSEYTKMVDKYAVKQYVADIIGSKYIIPTLGVWDNPAHIDWHSLPDQFVLKTTHGGGNSGVVICRDKQKFDYNNAIEKLNKALKLDIYTSYREWPYKNVPRRIIAEQYICSKEHHQFDLPDYKFFCFNGEPKFCQVIRGRNESETIDFYDMEWKHQEFVGLNPNVCKGDTPVLCPSNLEEMKRICRELSSDIPFLRVDLYVVDEKIYFGELTFYPASGFGRFTPEIWQYKLGDLMKLDGICQREL